MDTVASDVQENDSLFHDFLRTIYRSIILVHVEGILWQFEVDESNSIYDIQRIVVVKDCSGEEYGIILHNHLQLYYHLVETAMH